MNLVKTALTYAALFCVGAVTSVACFEPELENPSFRCNPSTGGLCPDGEACCSDDPAASGGKLPNYAMSADAAFGTPLFSNNNNQLSTQGMCVNTEGVNSPLAQGCPLPCNPTWTANQVGSICGMSKCCQTQELDPLKDCIMGADGKWRAVTGADIYEGLTMWGGTHATNQDPSGTGCKTFSQGNKDIEEDCIRQLSVANQRGFCYSECPCVEDVCALKNGDPPKCGAAAPGV